MYAIDNNVLCLWTSPILVPMAQYRQELPMSFPPLFWCLWCNGHNVNVTYHLASLELGLLLVYSTIKAQYWPRAHMDYWTCTCFSNINVLNTKTIISLSTMATMAGGVICYPTISRLLAFKATTLSPSNIETAYITHGSMVFYHCFFSLLTPNFNSRGECFNLP